MKLLPFSAAVCQELIDKGYSHFIIPLRKSDDDDCLYASINNTLKAVRKRPQKMGVPISHIMNLSENAAKNFYIMTKE